MAHEKAQIMNKNKRTVSDKHCSYESILERLPLHLHWKLCINSLSLQHEVFPPVKQCTTHLEGAERHFAVILRLYQTCAILTSLKFAFGSCHIWLYTIYIVDLKQ